MQDRTQNGASLVTAGRMIAVKWVQNLNFKFKYVCVCYLQMRVCVCVYLGKVYVMYYTLDRIMLSFSISFH